MSEEEEEPVRTRPKRTPGGVPKPAPAENHEYEERMVTSAVARPMFIRARLENERMHNVELGNLFCTTFNAMVAAQQEHNGIVREGMAAHARLLQTVVATEKKKAATFEKLLYRTGAIYSSMIVPTCS